MTHVARPDGADRERGRAKRIEARRGFRVVVAAALLVGVGLRLAFALGYWQGKPLTYDEREYLAYAVNLAAGRGLTREIPGEYDGPSVERFSRAPLYPAVLSLLFRATDQATDRLPASVPHAVQMAQSCLGALTIVMIARVARRAAGDRAAVIAAWIAALHPPLAWSCAYALSEALYTPLILCSVDLLGTVLDQRTEYEDTRDRSRACASGLIAGAAALTRSAALVFAGLAMIWLFVQRRVMIAAALALAVAVVIAPWAVRNYARYHRVILVAADGGVTFWTGNHPLAIGEGDLAANPRLKAAHVQFRAPLASLTPEQREPYYYRAAWSYIAQHPAWWIGLLARKLFYTFVPIGPSYSLHSPLYRWASLVTYVPLLLLSCAALARLARADRPPVALGLLVLSAVLLSVLFFPQERFRIPSIDPALCVGAAAFLSTAGSGAARRG